MKKSYLIVYLLFSTFLTPLFSQTLNRITIKGVVSDTTSDKMAFAYVMLLNPIDSTMLNYSRGDENGAFEFKNIKNLKYILKVSYINYLPLSIIIGPYENEINDLGKVKIKPIAKELMEVVVRTARAPLTIKGDTIEYDARAFKVPEGSTVEDLLRRLPGLEVDADGNIKAQGKDVKKVLVDGKTFFGDDPKSATKNLGAETISKVQVYNDKSEQAKLTGVDDGKKEKAINLELKDEFKKGKFGKITGAVGNESRLAAKGNYNKFNKNEQFSIIGYGNNINETGLNWNDYGEFKGSTQWQNENGDFGFISWGDRQFFFEGDGLGFFDGRGFTKNAGAGVNYNFDNKKTKFTSSYFYNQTKLDLNTISNRETFQQNGSFFSKDTTAQNNFMGNHSIGMRFEKMIDSSNTVIAKANIRAGANDRNNNNINGLYRQETVLDNIWDINNIYNSNSLRINTSAIYRHIFKKNKARNFAASIGLNMNNNDNDEAIKSRNTIFNSSNITNIIRAASLVNLTNLKTNQLKASLLFLEPLSKKIFWETFYNFSSDNNNTFRESKNVLESGKRVDSLSSYFENNILYNRVGSSLRYSLDGKNISVGIASVQYNLSGDVFLDKTSALLLKIDKKYTGITPYFDTNFEFNNTYLNVSYIYGLNAPQLNDLQPVVNNSSPFYITKGNPNLSPERLHLMGLSFQKYNPGTFGYIYLQYYFKLYDSQIIYNQSINDNFVTTTTPENLSGGTNHDIYTSGSYPLIKTKLTARINANFGISNAPSYINNILNETKGNNSSIGFNFNITPNPKFFMDLGAIFGSNSYRYSIQSAHNQIFTNSNLNASLKWNFIKKTFFESNFNSIITKNEKLNFYQNQPIFNASIR